MLKLRCEITAIFLYKKHEFTGTKEKKEKNDFVEEAVFLCELGSVRVDFRSHRKNWIKHIMN